MHLCWEGLPSTMLLSHTILCANGWFTAANECLTITLILILRIYRSLISSLNSTYPAMVHHVKQLTCSTMQKGLVGPTVKPLSRAGQISTSPLCLPGRWAWVHVIWPWMIAGVGGTGRRSWEWVMMVFLIPSTLTTDTFLRQVAPSVLAESSPRERETCSREQEVQCHIPCRILSRVVDDDTKLGMWQIGTKPIYPHRERYLNSYVAILHILMSI